MIRSSVAPTAPPLLPSLRAETPTLVKLGAVLAGSGVLALASQVQVPMIPVPITLQVLAVLLIGACFGARLAVATVAVWMAEAAVGLPVLTQGGSGVARLVGPWGGYILGFAVAAGLVGWFADRRLLGGSVPRTGLLLLLADAVILALGSAWLAMFVGLQAAWMGGVAPFLVGDLLKVALATAVILAAGRLMGARSA